MLTEIGHEKAQSVIDSITSSYAAEGQAGANPMLAPQGGPPPMGGPGFAPPPFGFPGTSSPPSPSHSPPYHHHPLLRNLTDLPSPSSRHATTTLHAPRPPRSRRRQRSTTRLHPPTRLRSTTRRTRNASFPTIRFACERRSAYAGRNAVSTAEFSGVSSAAGGAGESAAWEWRTFWTTWGRATVSGRAMSWERNGKGAFMHSVWKSLRRGDLLAWTEDRGRAQRSHIRRL